MVQPVQSPIFAPSVPFEPTTVNPLYQDQFGVSTLTQATSIRKPLIVLGFLSVVAALIIFLKKLFSTEPSVEAWVQQNYKGWDEPHQDLLVRFIAKTKTEIDSQVNPSLRAASFGHSVGNCSCSVCKNIDIYIFQYFNAHAYKPNYIFQYFQAHSYKLNEIDAWVEQNCDLMENDLFKAARVIQLAGREMQDMVNPDVRAVVYTFFNTIYGRYVHIDDTKILNCVLRFFRDKNQEVQRWLLSQDKNTSKEVLAQVVQRVNEIEKLTEYSQVSQARIRELRFETYKRPDPIQSKALSYLTHARVQADIKEKYGKNKLNNDFNNYIRNAMLG